MGQSADAKIAWGFNLEDVDSDLISMITELIDEEDSLFEMVWHGYDFEGHFLAIKETVQTAYWESPAKIKPMELNKEYWTHRLKGFCQEHGIAYQEPDWHLMAHFA